MDGFRLESSRWSLPVSFSKNDRVRVEPFGRLKSTWGIPGSEAADEVLGECIYCNGNIMPYGGRFDAGTSGDVPPHLLPTWVFICDKALDIAMDEYKLSLLN